MEVQVAALPNWEQGFEPGSPTSEVRALTTRLLAIWGWEEEGSVFFMKISIGLGFIPMQNESQCQNPELFLKIEFYFPSPHLVISLLEKL